MWVWHFAILLYLHSWAKWCHFSLKSICDWTWTSFNFYFFFKSLWYWADAFTIVTYISSEISIQWLSMTCPLLQHFLMCLGQEAILYCHYKEQVWFIYFTLCNFRIKWQTLIENKFIFLNMWSFVNNVFYFCNYTISFVFIGLTYYLGSSPIKGEYQNFS